MTKDISFTTKYLMSALLCIALLSVVVGMAFAPVDVSYALTDQGFVLSCEIVESTLNDEPCIGLDADNPYTTYLRIEEGQTFTVKYMLEQSLGGTELRFVPKTYDGAFTFATPRNVDGDIWGCAKGGGVFLLSCNDVDGFWLTFDDDPIEAFTIVYTATKTLEIAGDYDFGFVINEQQYYKQSYAALDDENASLIYINRNLSKFKILSPISIDPDQITYYDGNPISAVTLLDEDDNDVTYNLVDAIADVVTLNYVWYRKCDDNPLDDADYDEGNTYVYADGTVFPDISGDYDGQNVYLVLDEPPQVPSQTYALQITLSSDDANLNGKTTGIVDFTAVKGIVTIDGESLSKVYDMSQVTDDQVIANAVFVSKAGKTITNNLPTEHTITWYDGDGNVTDAPINSGVYPIGYTLVGNDYFETTSFGYEDGVNYTIEKRPLTIVVNYAESNDSATIGFTNYASITNDDGTVSESADNLTSYAFYLDSIDVTGETITVDDFIAGKYTDGIITADLVADNYCLDDSAEVKFSAISTITYIDDTTQTFGRSASTLEISTPIDEFSLNTEGTALVYVKNIFADSTHIVTEKLVGMPITEELNRWNFEGWVVGESDLTLLKSVECDGTPIVVYAKWMMFEYKVYYFYNNIGDADEEFTSYLFEGCLTDDNGYGYEYVSGVEDLRKLTFVNNYWFTNDGWHFAEVGAGTILSPTVYNDKPVKAFDPEIGVYYLYTNCSFDNKRTGDVNGDGSVNLEDVVRYRNWIVSEKSFVIIEKMNCVTRWNRRNDTYDPVNDCWIVNKTYNKVDTGETYKVSYFFLLRADVNFLDDGADLTDVVALRRAMLSGYDYSTIKSVNGQKVSKLINKQYIVNVTNDGDCTELKYKKSDTLYRNNAYSAVNNTASVVTSTGYNGSAVYKYDDENTIYSFVLYLTIPPLFDDTVPDAVIVDYNGAETPLELVSVNVADYGYVVAVQFTSSANVGTGELQLKYYSYTDPDHLGDPQVTYKYVLELQQ